MSRRPRSKTRAAAVIDTPTTAAMIIREMCLRQGQRALAATTSAATIRRALSTQVPPSPNPTEVAAQATAAPSPPPSIFSRSRVPTRKKKAVKVDTTVQDYKNAQQLRRKIGRVGANVEQRYRPSDVYRNPPGPEDVTLELLMASQAHMGHHTSLWNPANSRYIYGIREGIHIISLEQTAAHLRRAARVVEEVAYRGGLILFVGTRTGQAQMVTQAASMAKACHLFTKWTPGSITNSEIILKNGKMQILDQNDEPIMGMEKHINERLPLIPDLVVCLNPMENQVLLNECALVSVPTIGVIDTNAEPSWVTYPIPANDDSLRALAVLSSVMGRAGEHGHQRRLRDAKAGTVEWQTPPEVQQALLRTKLEMVRKKALDKKHGITSAETQELAGQ